MRTLWKSFKADFKNEHGNIKWKIGEWQQAGGKIKVCENGFHGSKRTIDAMRYVNCEILALVEVKGKHDDEKDKSAYEYMKIKKAWYWKKEDSVALAIFSAELCIKNFEKLYPTDKRPREAIEAAKRWLENPTQANQIAAESAAWPAAESVWSAGSAWSAESAWSAARSEDKVLDKCDEFIKERIKTLEEIK